MPPTALSGRRVLVTGARGFLGRHLLRHLLDAGAAVHATARPGGAVAPRTDALRWHAVDLTDAAAVDRTFDAADPDVVLHLAGRVAGRRDPALLVPMLEQNVHAAINVMCSAHRLGGRRVVVAGSLEEPHGAGEPPCSPYAASKIAVTAHAQLFHRQWELPVTVLRPAMVYGPDQPDETKLVPYAVTTMLAGQEPSFGSGTRLIDWVHVDDVCRAFLLAAAGSPRAAGLVADVGSGTVTSIADTMSALARLCAYDGPLGFGDRADRRDDTTHVADLTPAADVLGWAPTVGLDEGLAQTVAWYREHAHPGGPTTLAG